MLVQSFSSVLLLFSVFVQNALCANILYAAPMPSRSHHIWNGVLVNALVDKGHNVTYLSPDLDKTKRQNYTYIHLEGVYEQMDSEFDLNTLASLSVWELIPLFNQWYIHSCTSCLKSQGLQTLINYPDDFKFDLILLDITGGPCLYQLISRYKYPPAIVVTAFLLPTYVSEAFGNHLLPAYVPNYCVSYTTNMNFFQRVQNFLVTYYGMKVWKDMYPVIDQRAIEAFGDKNPPTSELERHFSIALSNTDPLLNYPQGITPNIIPVGGLHLKEAKTLPQDWQKILDNTKKGVILFSLGTNVRPDKLSPEIQQSFLRAFSQLEETVIWKFDGKITDLPKNVIIAKWLPQNDILAHPNVKLFIGHGGALSTQEAIYHGVPMIGIPFFVDQFINTGHIVEKKLGIKIDILRVTEKYVLTQLRTILDNPEYRNNVRRISELYRDSPETPLERGVFWIEYVLRHGGAQFLSPRERHMPFYQATSLDVVAFLLLIALVIIVSIVKILKLIIHLIRGFTSTKRKVKTN